MFEKNSLEDQAAEEKVQYNRVIEEQKTMIQELCEELQTVKEKHIFGSKTNWRRTYGQKWEGK